LREDVLREWFRSISPRTTHYQRIEDKLSAGIPDVNVCYEGVECWVELKSIKYPSNKHKPLNIGLRAAQKGWIHKRAISGGSVFILLQLCREPVGSGFYTYSRLLLPSDVVTEVWGETLTLERCEKMAVAKDEGIGGYIFP